MLWKKTTSFVLIGSLGVGLAPLTGCENLPGDPESQGAVIGGLGGAAAGAAIAKDNRILGALIGGALGAGGGYLIGANWDKIKGDEKEDAKEAVRKAEQNPATASDVSKAETADLNSDGFVTLDEVVAMEQADLSDKEMIDRLERTQQYFELTSDQKDFLRNRGVSDRVINAMENMDPQDDVRTASETINKDDDVEMRTDRDR